jgi:hypothetical protein
MSERAANDEQRGLPRVELEVGIRIASKQGQLFKASTTNISPDGLQIRCTADDTILLGPVDSEVAPGAQQKLRARLALPTRAGPTNLMVFVQLLYVTALAGNQRRYGMRFVNMTPMQLMVLDQFIEYAIEPPA